MELFIGTQRRGGGGQRLNFVSICNFPCVEPGAKKSVCVLLKHSFDMKGLRGNFTTKCFGKRKRIQRYVLGWGEEGSCVAVERRPTDYLLFTSHIIAF